MKKQEYVVVLKDSPADPVRLSYPHLFVPKKDEKEGKARWGADFILKKNGENHKKVHAAIISKLKTLFPGKTVKIKEKEKPLIQGTEGTFILNGICLKDGADKEDDGYGPDTVYVSSGRPVLKKTGEAMPSPQVRSKANQLLNGGENHKDTPFGGCYVHGSVEIYFSDHPKGGKRACADLRAVMYSRYGEPFGSGPVDTSGDFEGLATDESESLEPSDDI